MPRFLTFLLALSVFASTGCPGTVDPNEPRDRGLPGEAVPDSGADSKATDGVRADAAPADTSSDVSADGPTADQTVAPPDAPTSPFCTNKVDANTLALLTFEVRDAGGFFKDSGPSGHIAWIHGGVAQSASGKPGCTQAAIFDGGAGSYLEIDNAPAFSLKSGSVDLWVRFDKKGEAGLFSKDANGTDENGHITVFRGCDGSIVVRKQEPGNKSYVQCSPQVADGKWVHVGVNFGQGGLELYVDGKRAQRTDSLPCSSSYKCGTSTNSGIDGNSNPWVLGATAMTSTNGAATPIGKPLTGAIDSLRISKVRRTF